MAVPGSGSTQQKKPMTGNLLVLGCPHHPLQWHSSSISSSSPFLLLPPRRSAVEEYLVTGAATSGLTTRPLQAWQVPSAAAEGPASGLPQGLAACILVCSHKLRDKRCGVAGPLLIEELQSVCAKKGIQDKVGICTLVWGSG